MTSFVDDNGNYLEYSGADFAITKQCASIYEFTIKGDVSVNFELQNTSTNRKALGYFGINQTNNPAFSTTQFNIIRNGNFLIRGTVAIYDEEKNEKKDVLHCFFFSGNANWIKQLDFNLKSIETEAYTVAFSEAVVNSQSSATSGIIFPIIDYMYSFQKANEYYRVNSLRGGDGSGATISADEYFNEINPCIYVSTIVKEIARVTGFKFGGNVFTHPNYKRLIITHDGPDVVNPDTWISRRTASLIVGSPQTLTVTTQKVNFTTLISEGGQRPYSINSRWTADANSLVDFDIYIKTFDIQGYTVRIRKNGTTDIKSSAVTTDTIKITLSANVTKGDYYEIYITVASVITSVFDASLTIRPSTVPVINGFYESAGGGIWGQYRFCAVAPDIKAIDFIKWLSVSFGAVITFNPIAKTLNFTMVDSITATEDWTQYFKGSVFYYNKVTTNNYIRLPQGQEPQITEYNVVNSFGYGEANIKSQSKANASTDVYTSPFGACRDSIGIYNSVLSPFIQNVELTDAESYSYTSVTNSGGAPQFTGTTFPFGILSGYCIIRVVDDNGYYNGYYIIDATSVTPSALIFNVFGTFISDSTGKFFVQSATKKNPGARALLVNPSTNVPDFTKQTELVIDGNSRTSEAFAWYNKPFTGRMAADNLVGNLSFGPVTSPTYNAPTLTDQFYNKISKFFKNPYGKVEMLIPEDKFQNYNFDRFIYHSELNRYFFISSIENYKDSKTPCTVYLLMI